MRRGRDTFPCASERIGLSTSWRVGCPAGRGDGGGRALSPGFRHLPMGDAETWGLGSDGDGEKAVPEGCLDLPARKGTGFPARAACVPRRHGAPGHSARKPRRKRVWEKETKSGLWRFRFLRDSQDETGSPDAQASRSDRRLITINTPAIRAGKFGPGLTGSGA